MATERLCSSLREKLLSGSTNCSRLQGAILDHRPESFEGGSTLEDRFQAIVEQRNDSRDAEIVFNGSIKVEQPIDFRPHVLGQRLQAKADMCSGSFRISVIAQYAQPEALVQVEPRSIL